MNNDEKFFHQRWDFRRKEDENDSFSDYSIGAESLDKKFEVIDALVSPPDCNDHGVSKPAKAPKRKAKNDVSKPNKAPKRKAKNDVPKPAKAPKRKAKNKNEVVAIEKPKKPLPVKENKRRKSRMESKDMILEDLKTFSSSLIRELSVAREDMSERMREVARAYAPVVMESGKKKGGRAPKKKSQPQKGSAQLNGKAQKRARGPSKTSVKKRGKPQEQGGKVDEPMRPNSNVASNPGKSPQTETDNDKSAMPSGLVDTVLTPFSTFPTTMRSNSHPENSQNGGVTKKNFGSTIVEQLNSEEQQLGRFCNVFNRETPGFYFKDLLPDQGIGIGSNAYEATFGVWPWKKNQVYNKMQQNGDGIGKVVAMVPPYDVMNKE